VQRVAVINAGGWGTALAIKLANQGHDVRLWARRPELAVRIAQDRENHQYLPYVSLPPSVRVTSDLSVAVEGAEVVVVAVIAGYMREIARQLREVVQAEMFIVHGTKGVESQTYKRLSTVLVEELGSVVDGRVAVLSGPNHAEEVARQLPTAAVVACADGSVAAKLQELLNTEWFRVYTNVDVVGVELCSAAKNIIAIASGIGDGLGYGDNGKAALITRALAEMRRLVEAQGGAGSTVMGLAGVGDVIATCTSRHSRNRWAGEQIGQGREPAEIQASTSMVIEGIPATRALVSLARSARVEMPICEGVYRVLFEGQRPAAAIRELMGRDSTVEA
jgi:glycerol-3-phosphate dehydrogenase (NAD(P)+)